MHLYIKIDNTRRLLTEVYLKDGFFPCIGDYRQEVSVPPMEPAIWCKVLVLDSVLVDCFKRTIRWTTNSTAGKVKDHKDWRSFTEEISEYDDEDELFGLARTVSLRANLLESTDDNPPVLDDESKKAILKMLHCFVLPKVSFSKDDISKVEDTLQQQTKENQLGALRFKIKSLRNDVDDCEEQFAAAQKKLLTNIIEIISMGQLQLYSSKHFLDSLLEILEEDLAEQNIKLDKAGDNVVTAKQNNFCIKCLEEAKVSRDIALDQVLLVKTAIAEIKNQLQRKEFPEIMKETSDLSYDHLQFLEKRATFKRMVIEKNRIKLQERCVLIVQETLNNILNDLRKHGYSQLNGADITGIRPTDVLYHDVKPEWQTFSEQVASIISSTRLPLIKSKFEEFFSEINEMCHEWKVGNSTFYVSLEAHDINPDHEMKSPKPMTFDSSGEEQTKRRLFSFKKNNETNTQNVDNSDILTNNLITFNPYTERLEEFQRIIIKHFEEVSEVLSNHLNRSADPDINNKLRIAYENLFYHKIQSDPIVNLESVYRRANHESMSTLQWTCTKKKGKMALIKLSPLPIDDLWWQEVFEQREAAEQPLDDQCNATDDMDDGFLIIETPNEPSEILDLSNNNMEDDYTLIRSRSNFITIVKDQCQTVTSHAPVEMMFLNLLDEWDSRAHPIRQSFSSKLSQSYSDAFFGRNVEQENAQSLSKSLQTDEFDTVQEQDNAKDQFEQHFGIVIQHIRDILIAVSPLDKLKKMGMALKELATRATMLKMQSGQNTSDAAVAADDLLTLLVLMLLQMEPSEVALMLPHLAMAEDLMPPFLTSGYYGFALLQFQLALKVLSEL